MPWIDKRPKPRVSKQPRTPRANLPQQMLHYSARKAISLRLVIANHLLNPRRPRKMRGNHAAQHAGMRKAARSLLAAVSQPQRMNQRQPRWMSRRKEAPLDRCKNRLR